VPGTILFVGAGRHQRRAIERVRELDVRVVAVDRNEDVDAGRLVTAGVEVRLGTDEGAGDVDVLIKSPGVPAEAPAVVRAREGGVPVWSEVELGYRLLRPRPFVGVTGTKGKTTTTELLGAIFRAAGREVAVGGNVGRPLTGLDPPAGAWIVCELSSFQLEDVHELELEVAVLLNLEPDHIDRHGTFEAYRAAKLRIFERARHRIVPRGLGLDGTEFSGDDRLPAEPRLPGAHNRANAAAATAAARAAGIGDAAIAEALRTFEGVPHRLELVRDVGGVRFVNDSKATNPEAAERALSAYPPGVRLILGGSRKQSSYSSLARSAREAGVSRAYLIGESADEIAEALAEGGVRFTASGTLDQAVADAFGDAEPGEVVLLSPACASFDQFRDFEERGERFRELVEAL
jgi:UDP-N-acetylmuramoylalanine--D-glutamate ligase